MCERVDCSFACRHDGVCSDGQNRYEQCCRYHASGGVSSECGHTTIEKYAESERRRGEIAEAAAMLAQRERGVVTPSALTSLSDALYRHGYGPLASGHGILWPCDVARLHELATALRSRSSWRLAAACEHLAAGLAATDAALSLPLNASRAPHLQAAAVHYDAVVRLTR